MDNTTYPAPRTTIAVTDEDHLEDITSKYDLVIVEFYADWCGPCDMIAPILDDIADETRIAVARVDVDENQLLTDDYGVQGIPMMVCFIDGVQKEELIGVHQYNEILSVFHDAGVSVEYDTDEEE